MSLRESASGGADSSRSSEGLAHGEGKRLRQHRGRPALSVCSAASQLTRLAH